MKIILNGEPCECNDGMTLSAFLQAKELDLRYIAISLNRAFVPRAEYEAHTLRDGDDLEILTPRQGG